MFDSLNVYRLVNGTSTYEYVPSSSCQQTFQSYAICEFPFETNVNLPVQNKNESI